MLKIKEGFVLREIAGQTVVIALGKASEGFSGVIRTNDSGKFIWQMLESGVEKEDVISAMLKEYEADRAEIEADVDEFIKALKGADILE